MSPSHHGSTAALVVASLGAAAVGIYYYYSSSVEKKIPPKDDPKPSRRRRLSTLSSQKALFVIQKHFPGAITSSLTLSSVAEAIEKRGFTGDNTLYAQSVCPDEINHEEGDITNIFAGYLGEVFHLGGLAGVPFTGKTGFGAFSHHVPGDNGHLFVLMAPHVGLSSGLQLGEYSRIGQEHAGAACGAAVGALKHCCTEGAVLPDLSTSFDDYQMAFLINKIHAVRDQITKFPTETERQAELAKQTWKIGKAMLDGITSTDFGGPDSKLLVLTGIQINMPEPHEDYFQPLSFDMYTKTGPVQDLMEETFG